MAALLAMAAPGDGSGSNTRGWTQCALSATACVFGACIVYVDLFIRLLPGKHSFRIQDSRAFLACSLSLSFGVMIFSSLFSMLPSSNEYLLDGGVSERAAGFLMMAGFAFGYVGMQVVSRIIHRFMPSHVVDCDHTHGGLDDQAPHAHAHHTQHSSHGPCHGHGHGHGYGHGYGHGHRHVRPTPAAETAPLLTPLLAPGTQVDGPPSSVMSRTFSGRSLSAAGSVDNHHPTRTRAPRPSMLAVRQRVLSFVQDTKADCDEFGPCYGFTDPCGQECKRRVVAAAGAGSAVVVAPGPGASYYPAGDCAVTASTASTANSFVHGGGGEGDADEEEEEEAASSATVTGYGTSANGHDHDHDHGRGVDGADDDGHHSDDDDLDTDLEAGHGSSSGAGAGPAHHHHVPANAFLAIGLQTVLAIGLHKFPEGFIQFATNHANPALGLNVFVALFVHNIAEGFAMALPLYMALGSRARAVLWAAALGGLSQPLGAGAAALWLHHLVGHNGGDGSAADNGLAYGMLFAGTAGLMAAVALQLFAEGLTLHHNRQLSMGFAFVGMLLLGLSNSLRH